MPTSQEAPPLYSGSTVPGSDSYCFVYLLLLPILYYGFQIGAGIVMLVLWMWRLRMYRELESKLWTLISGPATHPQSINHLIDKYLVVPDSVLGFEESSETAEAGSLPSWSFSLVRDGRHEQLQMRSKTQHGRWRLHYRENKDGQGK